MRLLPRAIPLLRRPRVAVRVELKCVRAIMLLHLAAVYAVSSPYAYALFASSDVHACAVLTVAHRLQHVHRTAADVVSIVARGVSESMRDRMANHGIQVRPAQAYSHLRGYYEHAMMKLEPLRWYEYRRVIVLDADVFVQRSLDHLFGLPDVPLAAPVANWENEACITTALFIVQPSAAIWSRVQPRIAAYAHHQKADMVILNEIWEHRIGSCRILPEVLILPSRYLTLSTELTYPEPYHTDPAQLLNDTVVFHFSGGHGKPWSPNTAAMNAATRLLYRAYLSTWQCPQHRVEM